MSWWNLYPFECPKEQAEAWSKRFQEEWDKEVAKSPLLQQLYVLLEKEKDKDELRS
jgi:hypothetical protein